MSATFRIFLSSVLGLIFGSLVYGLIFSSTILVLDKVDKSSGWIGTVQNPVLIASMIGIIFGGTLGLLIGFVIGSLNINLAVKGAFVGFIVTECMIISFLVAVTLIDFSAYSNFDSLTGSIISIFFLFFILTFLFLVPSSLIGVLVVKLIGFLYALPNLKTQ